MSYSLAELAENIIQKTGEKVEIKGEHSFTPDKIQTLENADNASITFLANPKYAKMLTSANAGAVILNSASSEEWQGNALIMDNPYLGFAIVAQLLDSTPKQSKSVHATAVVAESCEVPSSVSIGANAVIEAGVKLGENVEIGAGCYIGQGTIVGNGTKIWPNVTVYHGVTIGKNCAIHAQTVIGADGFGYAPQKLSGDQHWHKIPQVGGVVIGDNTEIGASTTIDRGAIDDTIIGRGVIIDNQIQIGHNVNIGDFTAVAASTAIAGSTTIGRNVTIGGHCSIAGHLNIVDSAFITGRTFVISDIKEAGVYSSGMPASSNKEWRNNTARYRKLTELFTRVKKIEKKLGSE